MEAESTYPQTALITGGARRLGAALALALSKRNCAVAIHYNHSREEAEALVDAIRNEGGKACCIQADLNETAEVKTLFARAQEELGALDLLVNNASIFDLCSFDEMTGEAVDDNVHIHVTAPLLLGRAFAAQKRPGVIINMLDARMVDYDKSHLPYHLSKRVLSDLTRIMAVEFAPAVRVNAIAPGLILPPPGEDEAYLKSLMHTNLLNTHGSEKDVVQAALYLIDAPFVTGQTLYVDGGRNLRGRMYD